LIPPRLGLVSSINAIGDPDLQELAASDVRAILTRFADLRPLLVTAYARGSAAGKRLLDDSVKTVDPSFVSTLHGTH
jgi:N-acetylglucosamine kinase-like BadF-type ATPase